MAGGVAEVFFGGEGGGIGDGALEEGFGFGEFFEVNEGFGLVGFLLMQQEMREGGGGVVVLRIGGEEPAVGGFGGGGVAGGFGQLAGEEDVVGGFGGDFEGGEEFGAGEGGVGVLVDAGE